MSGKTAQRSNMLNVSKELRGTLRILRRLAKPEELQEIQHFEKGIAELEAKWKTIPFSAPEDSKVAVNFATTAKKDTQP